MSRIPTSAMPRASAPSQTEKEGKRAAIKKQAGKVSQKAKDNPKAAIAAGAVVAGAIAAVAAIPLVRAAKAKKTDKKESSSGTSKKKKS